MKVNSELFLNQLEELSGKNIKSEKYFGEKNFLEPGKKLIQKFFRNRLDAAMA